MKSGLHSFDDVPPPPPRPPMWIDRHESSAVMSIPSAAMGTVGPDIRVTLRENHALIEASGFKATTTPNGLLALADFLRDAAKRMGATGSTVFAKDPAVTP